MKRRNIVLIILLTPAATSAMLIFISWFLHKYRFEIKELFEIYLKVK